jgi:superoxide dismutase
VYEHAYYADFYTNRGSYIDEFLNFVDWKAVEALLPKA